MSPAIVFPRPFWRGEGGAREVLVLAYPLILSQMSFTIQVFVDRLFLTWYWPELTLWLPRYLYGD